MTTHVVYIVTVAECFRHYEHAAVIVSMQLSLRTCQARSSPTTRGSKYLRDNTVVFFISGSFVAGPFVIIIFIRYYICYCLQTFNKLYHVLLMIITASLFIIL